MTNKKTQSKREPLQVPPEVAERGRRMLEYYTEHASRSISSGDAARLLKEAAALRKAHGTFLRPFFAWVELSSALAAASKTDAVRECPEVAHFVFLLYQLVTDDAVHARGGPLRALESLVATLRATGRGEDGRAFVLQEWATHAEAYEFNKTKFAQDYRGRLLHEYEQKVSVRTIAERWLKG